MSLARTDLAALTREFAQRFADVSQLDLADAADREYLILETDAFNAALVYLRDTPHPDVFRLGAEARRALVLMHGRGGSHAQVADDLVRFAGWIDDLYRRYTNASASARS